ncbi:MAG: SCP2 sterol-binding domain-containing protein [Candidatus Heimdallarchaeota archaeon]
MALIFPSKEWLLAYKDALNGDSGKKWQEAASEWEGDFLFVIEPDNGLKQEIILYIDLWHGECRKVDYFANRDNLPETEFQYVGLYSNWLKLLSGEIDPIKGILMRKFKLVGSKAKVLRAIKAAQELIATSQVIDTEFL